MFKLPFKDFSGWRNGREFFDVALTRVSLDRQLRPLGGNTAAAPTAGSLPELSYSRRLGVRRVVSVFASDASA